MNTLNANLQRLLALHEGKERFPYFDTVGKVTIGIGRNLTDRGISESEISFLLSNDIDIVLKDFKNNFSRWNDFDDVRKLVIYDMLFNLGINKFLQFEKMITALNKKDFTTASKEMLSSAWAKQVGQRAVRLSQMMESGELPKELQV